MELRFSTKDFANIKRIAAIANPAVVKKQKIQNKINALQQELDLIQTEIDGHQAGLIARYGLGVEQLVHKVVENTGKTDKQGRAIKTTRYVHNDNISWDEEHRQYVIHKEEPAETVNTEEEHTEPVAEPVSVSVPSDNEQILTTDPDSELSVVCGEPAF